jgi:antitoxin component of RelBE/YafQ-DinJ toxin-antitoxin module
MKKTKLTVKIDQNIMEKLKTDSKEMGQTLSELIRQILDAYCGKF